VIEKETVKAHNNGYVKHFILLDTASQNPLSAKLNERPMQKKEGHTDTRSGYRDPISAIP
jgi:hypothetical protein